MRCRLKQIVDSYKQNFEPSDTLFWLNLINLCCDGCFNLHCWCSIFPLGLVQKWIALRKYLQLLHFLCANGATNTDLTQHSASEVPKSAYFCACVAFLVILSNCQVGDFLLCILLIFLSRSLTLVQNNVYKAAVCVLFWRENAKTRHLCLKPIKKDF